MKLAIWGHLAKDVEAEGSPEVIIDRCRQGLIDTYLAHVTPLPKSNPPAGAVYNSTIFQDKGPDYFTALLQKANAEGVEVQPWIVPFESPLLVGETLDALAPRTYRPLDEKPLGGMMGRYCPTWPENRACAVAILNDYINQYGSSLPGVHLDVFRYADVQGGRWGHPCHCDACRAQYARHIGMNTISEEDFQLPGVQYKFTQLRNRCIRELLEELRDITCKAGLKLTLAARASYFRGAILEGQDWPVWMQEGLLDTAYTMNYACTRELHQERLTLNMELIGRNSKSLHFDGINRLSSCGENSIEQVLVHADDAAEAGVDGICIFHYNGMKSEDFETIRAIVS